MFLDKKVLNTAANASASSTSKGIVLMNNSTLPAGTYTIPSGSVLLIPFDDANTLYKTEAAGREFQTDLDGNGKEEDATSERNRHTISYYRTLTMASGANIILNGEMSLSAMHLWAQGAAAASLLTQIFTNFVLGFIIKPIRENNKLLLKGLNPKFAIHGASKILTLIKNKI